MDGFEQCKADPCIFHKIVDGVVVMIIGVYLDDLLVGGSQKDCESLLLAPEQGVSNERPRRVHLVRWVWHGEERRVEYDQAVARSIH